MKLIRLQTQDSEGFFETQFNTEIVVKPNSKIALQSASFKSALDTIDINQSNNRLTFLYKNLTTGATNVLGIVLDSAFYTDTNFEDLFKDIQKKFNESMVMDSDTLGIDFEVRVVPSGVIEIGYRRGYLADFEVLSDVDLITENTGVTLAGSAMFNSFDVSNPDDRVRIISGIPIGNGVKAFRAVPEETGANTDGCKIGLLENASLTAGVLDAEFFIQQNGNGQPYTFLEQKGLAIKTTAFNATSTGANKDFIELALVGDEVIGNIYRHGEANPDVLFTTPYSQNNLIDLFPFVSIQAKKDDLTVQHVMYTPDMYFIDEDDGLEPITRVHSLQQGIERNHNSHIVQLNSLAAGFTATPAVPRPIGQILEGTLTMARQLSNYLGIFSKVSTATEGEFTDIFTGTLVNALAVQGTKPFKGNIFTKNFLIELNSIDIDSYDSKEGRRKNIIASIPKQEQIGVIEYEPNNLYFVDTKNSSTISLRNINARILNINGTAPRLSGTSVINLLIDEN